MAFDEGGVVAFLLLHHRGQYDEACAGWLVCELVHHLVNALRSNRLAALVAVRDANACIKQTEVIIDFCDGAQRGARIVAAALLFNGNAGDKPSMRSASGFCKRSRNWRA